MTNIDPGAPQYEYEWQNPNQNQNTFDFGRVFTRTIDILKLRGLRMLVVSMMLIGLPFFLISIWPMFLGGGFQDLFESSDPNVILNAFTGGLLAVLIIGVLLIVIASLWLQPALIKMSYSALTKEHHSNLSTLKQATPFVLPVFGFFILYALAVMVGLLLFIIPAIFIGLGWMLAAHIIVLEKKGVMDSISRAWDLTKGAKRWLLLLAIVFGVIGSIIGVVISIPIYIMGDPNLAMLEGASTSYWIVNGILSSLVQVISTVIGVAWATAAYVELRKIREGVDPESRVDVFS